MACGPKEQKVTTMVLKVDLDCCQCYRKVKKTLCKFPQIRNQVYDEKNNAVIITVVCCSPEKIRDKLCCKAGKSIKSIEIMENKPKPPPPVQKPPEKPPPPVQKPPEKPPPPVQKPPEKPPPPVQKPPEKPPPPVQKPPEKPPPGGPCHRPGPGPPGCPPGGPPPQTAFPVSTCCTSCYEGRPGGPCYGPGPGPPGCPPGGPPPQTAFPGSTCCTSCYEGRPGGPCYGPGPGPVYPNYGYYGRPCPPPPPCYRPCRCDYFSEENPAACSIM